MEQKLISLFGDLGTFSQSKSRASINTRNMASNDEMHRIIEEIKRSNVIMVDGINIAQNYQFIATLKNWLMNMSPYHQKLSSYLNTSLANKNTNLIILWFLLSHSIKDYDMVISLHSTMYKTFLSDYNRLLGEIYPDESLAMITFKSKQIKGNGSYIQLSQITSKDYVVNGLYILNVDQRNYGEDNKRELDDYIMIYLAFMMETRPGKSIYFITSDKYSWLKSRQENLKQYYLYQIKTTLMLSESGIQLSRQLSPDESLPIITTFNDNSMSNNNNKSMSNSISSGNERTPSPPMGKSVERRVVRSFRPQSFRSQSVRPQSFKSKQTKSKRRPTILNRIGKLQTNGGGYNKKIKKNKHKTLKRRKSIRKSRRKIKKCNSKK
jgi:hypothetical protein